MLSVCYEPYAKLESLQALSLVQDFSPEAIMIAFCPSQDTLYMW